MNDTNPTRRTDEPPTRDGAPLAGWPVTITAEEAVALRGALGQLQAALDAVVRERDEARAEAERLRCDAQAIAAIAHTGGTAGLSERAALVEIRRRTLKAWDRKTSRAAVAKP